MGIPRGASEGPRPAPPARRGPGELTTRPGGRASTLRAAPSRLFRTHRRPRERGPCGRPTTRGRRRRASTRGRPGAAGGSSSSDTGPSSYPSSPSGPRRPCRQGGPDTSTAFRTADAPGDRVAPVSQVGPARRAADPPEARLTARRGPACAALRPERTLLPLLSRGGDVHGGARGLVHISIRATAPKARPDRPTRAGEHPPSVDERAGRVRQEGPDPSDGTPSGPRSR